MLNSDLPGAHGGAEFLEHARTNAGVVFRDLEDNLFRFDSVAVSNVVSRAEIPER
jgi:hypothetical protein